MILQFGTSRFLQAHVDLFAHEAAEGGQMVPPIVIVQTTRDAARACRLAGFADPAGYEVRVRGLANGQVVQRDIQVRSVVEGLSVARDWERIVALTTGPVDYIVCNSSDAGYRVAEEDRTDAMLVGDAPRSFPAILLALLHLRWSAGAAGVTLLPCELVRANGDTLRDLLLELASAVGAQPAFTAWLRQECRWINTLVDRIVSGALEPAGAIAEPYALWAVEVQPGLVMPFSHPDVVLTDDLDQFERLKVHILNLGHSWLAEQWQLRGGVAETTIREMLDEPETASALRRLYSDEVVPGFAVRGLEEAAQSFVAATMDRFANPFLDHQLADIHVGHSEKVRKRIEGFVDWVECAGQAVPPMPHLRSLAAAYRGH